MVHHFYSDTKKKKAYLKAKAVRRFPTARYSATARRGTAARGATVTGAGSGSPIKSSSSLLSAIFVRTFGRDWAPGRRGVLLDEHRHRGLGDLLEIFGGPDVPVAILLIVVWTTR